MPSNEARVAEALSAVHRIDFLTEHERQYADADRPLVIGHGQTNSQPTTVRQMLTMLAVQPGDRVLDVGCGSGWTTALLGHLVGPAGVVRGVELVAELATWGRDNVAGYAMDWVSVEQADPAVLGLPELAPFDRILVSAEARQLPDELAAQLASPGRMVVPVKGRMAIVDRVEAGQVVVRRVGHYAFVPLRTPRRP